VATTAPRLRLRQRALPQLVIPLHQEQLFLALRLVSRGGAAMAFQDQNAYTAAIDTVQNNPRIR